MGITFTKATISNPRQPRRGAIELEFLIDTGAIFSVLPGPIARKLALAKLDREEFTLADGTRRAYDVGEAFSRWAIVVARRRSFSDRQM
jgi:predicted aspartyl protease